MKEFAFVDNIIPEEQGGFLEGYSAIDHIFTLYSMIMLQFSKNKKLYVCLARFLIDTFSRYVFTVCFHWYAQNVLSP